LGCGTPSDRPTDPTSNFTPVQISGGWAVALELVDGAIHLAYNDGDVEGLDDLNELSRPLYATDAGGSWSVTELANIGAVLGMHLSPEGASHVLFSAWDHGESDRVTLNYATSTAAGEPFVVEPAPLPPAAYQAVSALNPEGAPHIIWATWHYDDENDWYSTTDPAYSAMRDGAWLEPEQFPASLPEALAIDGHGALHAVGGFWSEDQESIWYSTNMDGEFASFELGCCSSETEDGEWMSPGIALDSAGRPHVFFATEAGTWYAIGPGN
jgi:hypothetical protein